MTQASVFKTPESQAAYLAAYDAAMKYWPVPYDEIEIPTRFGKSYVVASGPAEAPPLVLLHGFMGAVLMWAPNVADLSEHYRVYAVDVMGHRNRSIPAEAIRNVEDYVAWLSETFDGLNLDRVDLVGMSFGGWLALNLALTAPQRVRKLVLLSPAASFLPIVKQFTVRAMLSGLFPSRYWFDSLMRWLGVDSKNADMRPIVDLMYLGGEHIHVSPETMRVMPTVFTDEELRALGMPVLLMIGENEVIYDATKALARARRLIPDFDGELVPQCGHEMSMSQSRIVDARVLDFLKKP